METLKLKIIDGRIMDALGRCRTFLDRGFESHRLRQYLEKALLNQGLFCICSIQLSNQLSNKRVVTNLA